MFSKGAPARYLITLVSDKTPWQVAFPKMRLKIASPNFYHGIFLADEINPAVLWN